jgi:aminoglycoside phosphotransferase (APT) family kinase protein
MTRQSVVVLDGPPTGHPAAEAWRAIAPDAPEPERIEWLWHKKKKSATYRLVGVGPGRASIIAQRSLTVKARIERAVYEEILPHLPVAAPRYYGSLADGAEAAWVFLEDLGDEPYAATDPTHLALAARWVGAMHTAAAGSAAAQGLPDGGPARYLDHLRVGRDMVQAHLPNPALSPDVVATLRRLVAELDRLENRWAAIEGAVTGVDATLVHGDFRPKNARIRNTVNGPELVALDWEMAGWGVPAIDLLEIDLATYQSVVRSRWPTVEPADLRRLQTVGEAFRWLAAIRWAAPQLRFDDPLLLLRPVVTMQHAHRCFVQFLRGAGGGAAG